MESKTKVLGHSAHQITIVWPLGLLSTSVMFDFAAARGSTAAGRTAYSLLGAGLLGGLVAAPLGYNDWHFIPAGTRARAVGLQHMLANIVGMTLFGASYLLRRAEPEQPTKAALGLSLAASAASFLGGWLGGELVDRLGVGIDQGAHLNAPSSLVSKSATSETD